MRIKHLILIFLCGIPALFSQSYRAGEYEFLWPVTDSERGENIIMYPTDQIYNKGRKINQNYGHYLIGGKEDSQIQAVCDGVIVHCNYHYSPEFLFSYSYDDYKEIYQLVKEKDPEGVKWINYWLRVKIAPGKIINYIGFKAPTEKIWKTGEIVKKGDILGSLGYSVRSVDQPALDISLDINGKRGDIGPGLLGIDNQLFQDGQKSKNMKSYQHPVNELRETLRIMKFSLEEGHPALYEYSSRKEIDNAFSKAGQQLTKPMTSDQFYKVLMPIISTIRDNHTYLVRTYLNSGENHYSPRSYFPVQTCFINDKLYILEDPTGQIAPAQEISAINGKPVTEMIEELKTLSGTSDGFSEGWENINLNYGFGDLYLLSEEMEPGENLKISLSNGSQLNYIINTEKPAFRTQANRSENNFQIERINNNTILFNIYGMSLRETEKEEISDFFKNKIKKDDKVILDLRLNKGGEIEGTYFIFSLFAQKPFATGIENRVNSRSKYSFFQYTNNYSTESDLYPEYHSVDGRDGFYLFPEDSSEIFPLIKPADHNVKGKTYVLTNGGTGSAAVILSALFKHYGRGIIIGEEGAGAYHKMNGLDFAKVRLGKTGIVLNIPLVHTVLFPNDDSTNPAERGVIPDYIVKPKIEDIINGKDTVLDFIDATLSTPARQDRL